MEPQQVSGAGLAEFNNHRKRESIYELYGRRATYKYYLKPLLFTHWNTHTQNPIFCRLSIKSCSNRICYFQLSKGKHESMFMCWGKQSKLKGRKLRSREEWRKEEKKYCYKKPRNLRVKEISRCLWTRHNRRKSNHGRKISWGLYLLTYLIRSRN